jgi:hypothetical protein
MLPDFARLRTSEPGTVGHRCLGVQMHGVPMTPSGEMRPFIAITGFAIFILVLLFAALRSTGTPLEQSAADREVAQRTCQTLVRAQFPDARFPFAANMEVQGVDHLRLSGSVDSGATRRNYECLLRRTESGTYVSESVAVWQSH